VLAAGAAIGLVYAALDRRIAIGPRGSRRAGRLVLAALVAVLAVGTAGFFASVQSPREFAAQRWHEFTHQQTARAGSSHLALLGSNRYDFWRVALDEARAHPLAGIGGRGFYSAYLLHRRSEETPLRAHSLYLDVLAETGIPGLVLLLVGIGAPLALLARRLRRPTCVAAFGAAASFFTHAAVDWIWTVPAVGIPALLLLGVGCAGGGRRGLGSKASAGVAVAAAAAALLAFAPGWLSYRYVAAAYRSADPAPDLRRARQFDPLSLDPYFAAWRLARTPAEGVAALEGARRLEPTSVAVLYQLGLAYRRAGQRAAALAALQRAAQLDPREASIRTAVRSVRATLGR
jgi:tetratricopeptide (TPR) repeat protein